MSHSRRARQAEANAGSNAAGRRANERQTAQSAEAVVGDAQKSRTDRQGAVGRGRHANANSRQRGRQWRVRQRGRQNSRRGAGRQAVGRTAGVGKRTAGMANCKMRQEQWYNEEAAVRRITTRSARINERQ